MTSKKNPYGADRVVRGLKHFLIGKSLTSIAGIGTLLLIIRALPTTEFAAYSVLFGLVEVLLVLSALGTAQVLTRFIPEVYARHYAYALRRLLAATLGLRFVVLIFCVTLLYFMAAELSNAIGLSEWDGALKMYLVVALVRTGNTTLYQVLEAMLQQARGQGAYATVTVSKFVGVAWLYSTGYLDLMNLILVETATESAGLVLMSLGVHHVARIREHTEAGKKTELRWLRSNLRRIVGFGVKGYLQVLVILPFSGMVNRLVIGNQLPSPQVALFGFGQSIFDQMQRFLPAQLLAGTVRPVMAARYSRARDLAESQMITNLMLKINLVLIGMAVSGLVAGGGSMLSNVTKGKYGEEAFVLLLVMCTLIALESWRHVLDQLAHTVERYGFLVFTNAILGTSLLLGFAWLPTLGVLALPAANCVGLVVANNLVSWWLKRTGVPYRLDLRNIGAILAATACGSAVGLATQLMIGYWPVRCMVGVTAYAGFVWLFLSPLPAERVFLSLLSRGRQSA